MDVKSLVQDLLSAEEFDHINEAYKLLEDEEYEAFFNTHKDIISEILMLDTYLDFMDFLEEEHLNKAVFLIKCMEKRGLCIEIGGYEWEIQDIVADFLKWKFNSVEWIDSITGEEVFTDFDGEDNFIEFIRNVNEQIKSYGMQMILFFQDVYVQCAYSLVLVDIDMADKVTKEWDDEVFELVLI